jgi:hypothetical protein
MLLNWPAVHKRLDRRQGAVGAVQFFNQTWGEIDDRFDCDLQVAEALDR